MSDNVPMQAHHIIPEAIFKLIILKFTNVIGE